MLHETKQRRLHSLRMRPDMPNDAVHPEAAARHSGREYPTGASQAPLVELQLPERRIHGRCFYRQT